MKYMLLIYSDENAWTKDEREQCYGDSVQLTRELDAKQLTRELDANDQFLGAAPLHSVATVTSVRVRDGKKLVTDGPFAETREQLGGYFLIDATDLDTAIAIAIAARLPSAYKSTIEIRPIVELLGLPSDK